MRIISLASDRGFFPTRRTGERWVAQAADFALDVGVLKSEARRGQRRQRAGRVAGIPNN